ncbi:Ig-like domain-containing protein [Winogradskyella sp.]|uniref:T9SS type A sorting domain-containing protein n=1 Tax=Winogradskyella sp. TaxID=1883156 RepID=UPI001B1AF0C9|nr:Ig-like domain-containing protein [Winogradskyella sp.]MBO6880221.1 Ig-like domain-containing protein [Winogradskyella sp.]
MSTPNNLTKTLLGIVFFCLTSLNLFAQIPAFPGAEGYGKYTVGGRGGQVIEVTNLNDSGPGSFRAACEASGPRVVIFKVGGRIDLTGPTIKITNPNITIAGQTAPGGGIMLTRETIDRPILEIDADEVIIRYMRFRRSTSYRSGNNADNVWVNSGNNIIFDHCSFAWSSDGNLDIANYDGQPGRPPQIECSNITIQYSIFTNSYGGNNKTFLVSRGPTNISWFRNAWLSTATRNPSVSTPVNEAPTWDCYYEHVNNFHYDYTNGPSYNNNDPSTDAGIYYVNVIKNWAKENGNPSPTVANTNISSRRWLRASTVGNGMEIYVEDNITPYRPNDSYDQWEIGQNGGGQADNDVLIPENLRSYTINNTPIITDNVALWDAMDIWDNLRDHVGASLPLRDAEDARAVNDVDLGISTENKVNNVFPIIVNGIPYPDNDIDGMPDSWEIAEFGDLNSDGVIDTDGDGYTDLEEFLNQTANGQIPDIPAVAVEVSPETATINIPETISLTKTFTPVNTTNQSGVWTSSDPSIATVDTNGLVSSVAEGEAIITFTANDGGFTDQSTITVTNIVIPLESITVTPDTATLDVGEAVQLTKELLPEDTTDTLGTWTSSDESVATVDDTGLVTAISEGEAVITYTASDSGMTDSSAITVIDTFYGTYELYNATTDQLIQNIVGDADVNLGNESNEINFRSIPQGGDDSPDVESVQVVWTGPTSGTWVESGPIYAGLPGGHVDFDFEPYVVEAGTYTFTVTYYSQDGASGNVVAVDNFALTFYFSTLPVANAGPDQEICDGDAATLTASGGPNFLWDNGETTATIVVNPLVTTTYTVSVFDNEGNIDEDSVTVTVNPVPVADAGADVTICEGETTTLTANGGTTYLWSTGETTATIDVSPTSDTTYTVEVTNNNCTSTDDVTVFVNNAPDITVSDDIVIVEGESTTLTANGGDNYTWSTGETTPFINVTPTATTTYSVTSLGVNGCSTTVEVTVTVVPEVIADAGNDVTICAGEEVTLNATGGTIYSWDTGDTTSEIIVTPTVTTTYTVTVEDDYGYSDTDSVTVTVNETPDITVNDDVAIVDGETVTLTASGGDNYQWNTGETTASIDVSPSVTTTYTVISTAVGGCADIEQVTVTIIPEVVADAGEDVVICSGESVTLNATGGVTYTWNTGGTGANPTVSPTVTTTYTVTVEDAYGYTDTDSVTVTVNQTPNLTVTNDITIIEGEVIELVANGAAEYLWNTGDVSSSITVSPSQTTTYTVTGTTGTCSAEAQVTVTVEGLFEASAGEDRRVCENDTYEVVLTANTGDSYLWSTGETTQSITVSPLSTTTYTVTVTEGSQEDTDDVTVFVDPNPNVVIVNGNSVNIMNGDFVTLSATGANTYQWNNGATQPNIAVSPSQTTTYEVRGYIGDCYDEKQVVVNVIPEVEADAGEDVEICLGETVTLTATGGDEYEWSTGESTQSIQVSPNTTTEYTVTVFNALDFDEDSVMVFVDDDCDEEGGETGVPEDPQNFSFDVFPNPAKNYVNVKLSGSVALSRVHLYDITGKLIHSEIISNDNLSMSTTTRIDVTMLRPGMYIIKMNDIDREITKRLIIR